MKAFICVLLVASTLAINPGVNVGISMSLMNEFKDQVLPRLFQNVTQLSDFPPFEVTTGESIFKEYYTINIVHMDSFSFDTADTTLTVFSENEVQVNVQNMDMKAAITYTTHGVFNEDGEGQVSLNNSNFELLVKMGRNGAYPEFTLTQAKTTIGSISLSFNSGWIMKILSALTSAFSFIAKPIIEDVIDSSLTTLGNDMAKQYISTFPTFITVPCTELGINYGLVSDPILSEDYMTVGVTGQVYINSPNEVQPIAPAVAMPTWNVTGDANQFYLSEYTINSAFYAVTESGMGHIKVIPSMIPANIPFQLNTAQLNGIIPGFTETYGDNQPCTMEISLKSPAPEMTISSTGIAGEVNGTFEISVLQKNGTESSAITLDLTADVSGLLKIVDNKIFPTFQNATFSEVNIVQTQLPDLKPSLVKQNMNIMLMLMRGFLSEQVFSAGFPLPAPAGISYANANGIFHEGYALFESNPDISGFANLSAVDAVDACNKPATLSGDVASASYEHMQD